MATIRTTVTHGPAFERYAAECRQRTGLDLAYITVERTGLYLAVDGVLKGPIDQPTVRYTLWFDQSDGASEDMDRIDEHGLEAWLEMMHGATEYFLPHHAENYAG